MKGMSSKQQTNLIAGIEQRRAILENAVLAVAKGFSPALFIWGPPGLGKSHLLTTMLDGILGKNWSHHTGHSTPKALLLSLYEEKEAVHLFEDCEKMLKADFCASMLRAACGSPNDRARRVTYRSPSENLDFDFTGGVIIATNENLSKTSGPLQGVASRFRPIRWEMSLVERIATILMIAERPCVKNNVPLTVKDCRKVAKRLIEMTMKSKSNLQLDIRLFTEHALPAYAQSLDDPRMNWEDLLLAKLIGAAQTIQETQQERTLRLQELANKIDLEGGQTKEKVAKWKSMTELGQAIYYRHLREGKKK